METIANPTTMDAAKAKRAQYRASKRKQYRAAYIAAHPDKYAEEKRRSNTKVRAKKAAQRAGGIQPVIVVDPQIEEQRLKEENLKRELSKAAHKVHVQEYNRAYYAKLKAARIAMAAA